MVLFLVLGFFIGSFLNVLIYRLPKNESFLKSRSYCDNCKKTLPWYDLIPLLSFVFLKGGCRFCKKNINYQIPLVEAVTGVLFAALYLKFSDIYDPIFYFNLLVLSGLIVIFFTDLNNEIIPDKILFPLFVLTLFFSLDQNLLNHIFGGLLSFLFFLVIYLLSKGKAMGFGDVKFASLLGLLFGLPLSILSFYVAFLTGGITSLILILWGKKSLRKDTIPFGPFLSLGGVISIFLGDLLVSRLLSFLQ